MTKQALSTEANAAAQILLARRQTGEKGPRLPAACRPQDTNAALAVQAAVAAQIDDSIGGWKCALPSDANLILAPIFGRSIQVDSPCRLWTDSQHALVEPELAFVIGRDLPPREEPYSLAEIDIAIVRTHLALELVRSRYDDPASASFAEMLADNLVNQGLFIGPEVDAALAVSTEEMQLQLNIANADVKIEAGRHPSQPRAPLYWLAEFLRSRGEGLCAGQTVITGSYAGTWSLPVDEEISIRYGDLGTLRISFSKR